MKLFVRVAAATKAETFRRCGMQFTRDWTEVDVDEATANRLVAEQMLDVAEGLDENDLEDVDLSENPGMSFDEAMAETAGAGEAAESGAENDPPSPPTTAKAPARSRKTKA